MYVAASEHIFFSTARVLYEGTAEDEEELSFYAYWSSYDSEYKLELATLFLYMYTADDNLVHVTLRIDPQEDYRLNSLTLEIGMILPVSAVILGDPQSEQPPDFDYVRTDRNGYVDLDFSAMDFKPGEAVNVDFWLDLSEVEPNIRQGTNLNVSFSLHESSVFKVLKYEADTLIDLALS